MAKRGLKTVAPRLRFPEFRAGTGWGIYQLSSVADVAKGVQLSSSLRDKSAKFPHFNGGITYSSRTSRANRDANTTIVSEGGNSCGYVQFVEEPFWCGGHCYSVTPKRPEANRYLFYVLQAKQKDIMGLRVGSGLPNIQKNALEQFEVAYAEDSFEQQRIADCLTSLDEVIAAQGRKVAALKAYKRGLTQQIFPRERESCPRLRFPEFLNDGEWEKMTFGRVATFHNGRAYKQEELLEFGKYPVLRVGNFFTNTNWYYSNLELDQTKYCENGDLLYAWSASFGPRIWHGEKSIYHYHIWKVTEQPWVDKTFLFISLENETDHMKARTTNGLGIMHITKGAIESWESSFPKYAEQKKIAACLTSLSEAITAETKKLDALNVHRDGLMQQLFPSPTVRS